VRLPRGLLGAILAVRLFDEASAFLPAGTFEPLRADLGLTYAQASSAFLVLEIGAAAGTIATVATDYFSRRVICAGGAFLYAVALVVVAMAHSYLVLLAGSFLIGVAATALVDAAEVALADLVGDDGLERQLATQNVLGSVGDLLGPALVIGVLSAGLSWRVCFEVCAVAVALYAVWLATLSFPPPHPKEDGHTVRGSIGSVIRDPIVWLLALVGLLMGPLDEPLLAFLIAHLEGARDMTAAGATLVAMASVAGAFLGYASIRRVRSTLPLDAVGLAAATTCVVVAPEAITAGVASLLIGVFLARVWIDLQARTLRIRPRQTGAVIAVVSVLETAGWLLPLGAGALADRLDVTAGLAMYALIAWALAGAAFLLHRVGLARSGL
jgi:MFS family permease